MRFLPEGQLGRWMAERIGIWQMHMLHQRRFASFAKDRGLPYSFGSDIEELWRVGLMKADLVMAKCELEIPGLELLRIDREGNHTYLDVRDRLPVNGLSDSLKNGSYLPCEVELCYHPFRYFVLYQVDQILKLRIHPRQQLFSSAGYRTLLEHWQEAFDEWTRGPCLRDMLRVWEGIAELAIATEPYAYGRLFNVTRQPVGVDDDAQLAAIQAHWEQLRPYYEQIRQREIEKAHQELCITGETLDPDKLIRQGEIEKARQHLCIIAERLDPNKTIHNILRLTSGERRITNVKGNLGGSLLLLTMAEMLRRAEEEVFDVKLPEEDERGFGITYADAKREFYGSERLLDGDRKVADEFLRQQGLDYGVRVRWYLEGETEYYAVESMLGDFSAIQLINLRGRVAERGDAGVSFRDSLRKDIAAGVFSWVSIDGDRLDFARAVRKAAEDDEICGAFHITEPDFEFGNFTLAELEEVLWEIALENGADSTKRAHLHDAIRGANSATELPKFARRSLPELTNVGKGAEWGRRLMEYALVHLEAPLGYPFVTQPRPMLDALQWAIHATSANYKLSRETLRVDPKTGRSVSR